MANVVSLPQKALLDMKIEKAAKSMLPAYLMYAIGLKAKEDKLELREDFFTHLRQHMAKSVEGLDQISEARTSSLVADRALELCTAISTPNSIHLLYAIMYAILKAVDEGVIADVQAQPVLYSLLLINESEDDGFATRINKAWCKQKAGELFYHCYKKGYLG